VASSYTQILQDFIGETEPLIARVAELPPETAVELYELYNSAAISATARVGAIDPELRVTLCDRQDKILERIVDFQIALESQSPQGVFTPAVQGFRHWRNEELLKDKGLAGYLMARELAYMLYA
jgi:hypothetical protein